METLQGRRFNSRSEIRKATWGELLIHKYNGNGFQLLLQIVDVAVCLALFVVLYRTAISIVKALVLRSHPVKYSLPFSNSSKELDNPADDWPLPKKWQTKLWVLYCTSSNFLLGFDLFCGWMLKGRQEGEASDPSGASPPLCMNRPFQFASTYSINVSDGPLRLELQDTHTHKEAKLNLAAEHASKVLRKLLLFWGEVRA